MRVLGRPLSRNVMSTSRRCVRCLRAGKHRGCRCRYHRWRCRRGPKKYRCRVPARSTYQRRREDALSRPQPGQDPRPSHFENAGEDVLVSLLLEGRWVQSRARPRTALRRPEQGVHTHVEGLVCRVDVFRATFLFAAPTPLFVAFVAYLLTASIQCPYISSWSVFLGQPCVFVRFFVW